MILFIVIIYMILMLGIGWWSGKYYIQGMTDFCWPVEGLEFGHVPQL